ncbi:MAG: 16S rRNA (cytosine(1402)-N(4))-methyltransferase, partial [Alphaproteobacteria bacterium]
MDNCPHIPVLLKQVLQTLSCDTGGVYVDGTFGAGGYTRAILAAHEENRVIAFDRDPNTFQMAAKMHEVFPTRFTFIHDCFSNMAQH